ncbi:MAG: hypothetical protein L0G70_08455 [Rubrobacter sp.]|nr:hypothetical protein [Rubrobacter sp.]
MRSVSAILFGMLLALVIGAIVLLGILAPVFTVFMGMEGARMTPVIAVTVAVAVGMSFYFGGMLASYRAPRLRQLHGVLVAVVSFGLSLLVNLLFSVSFETNQDPLANVRFGSGLLLTVALFVVSVAAAYIGSRRGEGLYAYNLSVSRRMAAREKAKARRAAQQSQASEGEDSES